MNAQEIRRAYDQINIGDRVQIVHEVKVGFRSWNATTEGEVVEKQRRLRGEHYQRSNDDHVYSDVLVLRRDSRELTTVTMDEFSQLTILGS